MKRILIIIAGVTFLLSCGQKAGETTEQATELTVIQAVQNSSDFVNKSVKIEGTVVHVCRHGGKRLFLTGENPEEQFKIVVGPDISVFDVSLEGSQVVVEGTFKEERIDAAYLDQREAELKSGAVSENKPEQMEQGHTGTSHAEGDDQMLAQIQAYRQKLAESGKDFLAYYSIECQKISEKKVSAQ